MGCGFWCSLFKWWIPFLVHFFALNPLLCSLAIIPHVSLEEAAPPLHIALKIPGRNMPGFECWPLAGSLLATCPVWAQPGPTWLNAQVFLRPLVLLDCLSPSLVWMLRWHYRKHPTQKQPNPKTSPSDVFELKSNFTSTETYWHFAVTWAINLSLPRPLPSFLELFELSFLKFLWKET